MKDFTKIIENVVNNSQVDNFPNELQPGKLFTWDTDLNSSKDWDDFTGGQLVCHTYWDKNIHKCLIDVSNLSFGNNPSSYWGMLTSNEIITVYTSEFLDLTGKFISIGENIEDKYYATSYELSGFSLGENKKKKSYLGKIVLVNVQKYLDNEFNESNQGPIINIINGKLNETITVPSFDKPSDRQPSDPNTKYISEKTVVIPKMSRVEILFPEPAIMIGGIDFVANTDRTGNALADSNRLITPALASTNPKTLPIQPYYCIIPTQWNVPSIDNYGWTHPADRSNFIKTLSATQSLGSTAATGLSLGASSSVIGTVAKAIGSATIGMAQKHFGDKGTLANSTAINSTFLSGDGDPIKFFIQGDGIADGSQIDKNGYLDVEQLDAQGDYMEVNQANGDFGKYGKAMSPSVNGNFDRTTYYRALGLSSIDILGKVKKVPAIATPFTTGKYSALKINDTKKNDYMLTGSMRLEINSGEILKPLVTPNTWDVYIRNMFFRPDPYSFWNWPCMMPAEIGVFNVFKRSDISYDVSVLKGGMLASIGVLNGVAGTGKKKTSMWNKTIVVGQLTDNNFYDPNKTYSSYRYEFKDGERFLEDFYQIQMTAMTASTMLVNVLDENDKIIRTHNFNSQGLNVGTASSWATIVQL